MENARCNIELGNDRFDQATEWKDEIRIDVRECEIQNDKRVPTKKGISPPTQMEDVRRQSRVFGPGPERKDGTRYTPWSKRVLYRGICVDIRQHWLPPNQTKVVPTKKGITLRQGEYAKLKDVASVISDFVPELNSVVPCPYRSDHMHQLGFLSCSECNPYHCAEWWIDCDICFMPN